MRVLVTGAAGFIGWHVAGRLLEAGHEVIGVDSLDPAAHRGRPPDLQPDVRWEFEDVRDAEMWTRLLPGVDAVCHQAAKVGLGVDLGDAPAYVSHNDLGTATMLAALFASRFEGPLVLASSMVVYGEGAYECAAHGRVRPGPRAVEDLDAGVFDPRCADCGELLAPATVQEDEPLDPRNVYAATKAHQEHLATAWARETGNPATLLRYHNVYGPRMPRDTPYAGVMSIFASSLAAGRPPRVFEDGAQRRDFVHVDDVARANLASLTCEPAHDGALNVASGHPCTLLEAARILASAHAELCGSSVEPQVVGGYRLGDVRHVTADASLARDRIGFTAEVEPALGLARFAGEELREPPAA